LVEQEVISAAGHSYKEVVTLPTCTEPGYTTHLCLACGDSYVDGETPATGHHPGEFTVVTPPTETNEGLEKAVCMLCGEEISRPIPALGGSSVPAGGGGGGFVLQKYQISIAQDILNGVVSSDRKEAEAGQTVTLTVSPARGYRLDSLSVFNSGGIPLTVTTMGEDIYCFSMPGCAVTVTAKFDSLPPAELPFTDVAAEDWYYEAVSYVYSQKLMDGVSASQFAPEMSLTRAMLTTVLWRMEGAPAGGGTVFLDVAEEAWYAQAVSWAAEHGLVEGYGGGRFGPEDPITREQLAVLLYRYAHGQGDTGEAAGTLDNYSDGGQVSPWALEGMTWAVNAGLISGKGGGRLDPGGTALRGEIAALLQRFRQREPY
ncbi:S-layer homology domain-containing protein, partial [uncultured Flavonifractor sp.]|uniref:S-layer homology domain-containing protein n=1 Tax=uncultured Flavonifractor sp. TaxID=1193534 RepID=UPI002635BD42